MEKPRLYRLVVQALKRELQRRRLNVGQLLGLSWLIKSLVEPTPSSPFGTSCSCISRGTDTPATKPDAEAAGAGKPTRSRDGKFIRAGPSIGCWSGASR